jgi:hypothetical protein
MKRRSPILASLQLAVLANAVLTCTTQWSTHFSGSGDLSQWDRHNVGDCSGSSTGRRQFGACAGRRPCPLLWEITNYQGQ